MRRHITGHGADLALTPTSLSGSITYQGAFREIYLLQAANDDDLLGVAEIFGLPAPFVVRGRKELWAMPAADQAMVLPFMLTCPASAVIGDDGRAMFGVDFRGG